MPTGQIDPVNPLIATTSSGGSRLYEVKTNQHKGQLQISNFRQIVAEHPVKNVLGFT